MPSCPVSAHRLLKHQEWACDLHKCEPIYCFIVNHSFVSPTYSKIPTKNLNFFVYASSITFYSLISFWIFLLDSVTCLFKAQISWISVKVFFVRRQAPPIWSTCHRLQILMTAASCESGFFLFHLSHNIYRLYSTKTTIPSLSHFRTISLSMWH